MIVRKAEWFLLIMVIAAFVAGVAFYPHLPAEVATHWDAQGNVNGFVARFWGVFLLPIAFLLIAIILFIIPRADPRRDNIARFRKYFDYFLITFGIFFLYVYLLFLLWNLGYQFNFTLAIIPPVAGLIYLIGMILPHTERNFTIGIRTPWTISSETVWKKTHAAGGIVFKICAVVMLLGIVFPQFVLWLILVPIIIGVLGLVIYSYVLYERERNV